MGKNPNEFIPVKYDKHGDDNLPLSMMNIFIGAMFCAFFYSIYKNRNQGMSTGLKKGSKNAPKDEKKGGGFFGGGGMNDMFGMSKSNAK